MLKTVYKAYLWNTVTEIVELIQIIFITAVILLTRAISAKEFLVGIKNTDAVQRGEIAFIHIDAMDMFSYDVLQFWRFELRKANNLGVTGQSLLIITILPMGAKFDPNSTIFLQVVMILTLNEEHKLNLHITIPIFKLQFVINLRHGN